MKDQAHTLRRIFEEGTTKTPEVLSVTSGKGGVGKTSIVVNMGILMASRGKKVLVLDADLGLANVDVMLGMAPKLTIKHVLDGQCAIEDIVLTGPGGIKIIPASSGIQELSDLNPEQQISLVNALDHFDGDFDYMIVDTGAGISRNVMYFNAAAQRIIVVATAEPTSITDAYALIKVLRKHHGIKRFDLIVNNVTSKFEGDHVAEKLMMVCDRFLGDVALEILGSIPHDKSIPECIKAQKAFVGVNPNSDAAKRLARIVGRLEDTSRVSLGGNLQFFFRKMLLNQAKGTSHAGYSVHGTY
ncbi:MAG TPA: MinD/ParA family protein [Deltaproteobacteria bacterium]|nr:MinD/ParA family protein [Deltaproteobacteria bacterium]HPR55687.1 MinD/ParA family protein [Deltaproteobacteria bacterium]